LSVNTDIKFLSKKFFCLLYLKEILFNFENGIFYKLLRTELGLIYNIDFNLNINLHNSIYSEYIIKTDIDEKNISLLIEKILNIIENLEITNIQIKDSKKKFVINNEFTKFNDLTSFHTYYIDYMLHKIPIVEKSSIYKKLLKISNSDIRNTLKTFKHEILNNGILFYYSSNNKNNKIRQHLCHEKKIDYINLN
jgi:hypothetical protein